MSGRLSTQLFACAALLTLTGCRLAAPIHVWQPPQLKSTVGKQVVISTVAGPDEIAEPIRKKLIALAPRDPGRQTEVIDAAQLQSKTKIRLVSATDDEMNELAVAPVARRHGADFLLRGEVIENRRQVARAADHPQLTISWRLSTLDGLQPVCGTPVVVDLPSAINRYPELAIVADPQQALIDAAVRDTYRLMTPSVSREQVDLEVAYLLPGSRQVRRGIAAALAGRWGEAESIWRQVVEDHPSQVAATHNLALAAAAGQDFSRAKQLARKAVRLQPTPLHKQTLVWIELKQRAYHQSFNLPDPPEGWFVSAQSLPSQRFTRR